MNDQQTTNEAADGGSDLTAELGALADQFECHAASRSINDVEAAGRAMRAAVVEIESLQAMYDSQCSCTDEWFEKYRAEVERTGDETLLRRVNELEYALAMVNARLTAAQAVPNAEVIGASDDQ